MDEFRPEADPPPAPSPAPPPALDDPHARVAPSWHTVLLLSYITGITLMSATSAAGPAARAGASTPTLPRPILYATVLITEWILFAIAYWGVRLRGLGVGALVRNHWRGGRGLMRCLLIAAGTWAVSFIGLAQALDAMGFRSAEDVERLADMVLPRGPLETAMWFVVSATAGFVEEFVFRGYLQRQFASWCGNTVAGVALSAAVFAGGHAYQGLGAVVMIFIIGLCLSAVAVATKSLLPSMLAHGWEDFFSGLIGRA